MSNAVTWSWPDGVPELRIAVRGGAGAPAAARRAVEAWLGDHLPPERRDDALILISELVTNAVRHGGADETQEVIVRLAATPHAVHGKIVDQGPGFVAPSAPSPRADGGFGLVLLQQLSRRWRVSAAPGATVSFELAREVAE